MESREDGVYATLPKLFYENRETVSNKLNPLFSKEYQNIYLSISYFYLVLIFLDVIFLLFIKSSAARLTNLNKLRHEKEWNWGIFALSYA